MTAKDRPCPSCGRMVWRHTTGVCKTCVRIPPTREAICSGCGSRFLAPRAGARGGAYRRTCSDACREATNRAGGRLGGSQPKRGKSPGACDNCGNWTAKGRNQFGRLCSSCAIARRRAYFHTKGAQRRGAKTQGPIDVTLSHEAHLMAAARRCPICKTKLVAAPYLPASKELDHIIPLHAGGTHTIGNVRIVCRSCNVRRPKDGSDYLGPIALWAT
jgi:5-methylcytosine-specific restriction endonuclease McrA